VTEQLSGGAVQARSAGSHPKSLHPNAVRSLRERGIDIGGRRSKHLNEFSGQRFDYVVSLCDRVREVCPELPGHPDLIHWSVPDPGRETGSDTEIYRAFEHTTDELAKRIAAFLELVEHTRSSSTNPPTGNGTSG
jgi:ArsR family transcriptional regulator, arsenate/arsenite/antimonite-responsive transcriptional repressor / arsenate reductase (thioredoxin)